MKIKATVFALFLTVVAAHSAFGAIRYVKAAGGAIVGDCLTVPTACTLTYALTVYLQGDTIEMELGAYSHPPFDINKDFVTLTGPPTLDAIPPYTGARSATVGTCDPTKDVCLTGTGAYVVGIAADNVIIKNLVIMGTPGTPSTTGVTWAGILVKPHVADTDKRDRWTIFNNAIQNIDGKKTVAPNNVRNHSYGVYAESRETTGTAPLQTWHWTLECEASR